MKGASHSRAAAEQALNAIPGMMQADLLEQLSDGPTNASFRAEQDGRYYVLRLDKPGAATLGLDRHNEHRVSRVIHKAGLGPEPVFLDPVAGVYLRRFLHGRSWAASDLEDPQNLLRLAQVLRTLHELPPEGRNFDPLGAARRYARQLDNEASSAILGNAESQFQKISEDSTGQALCHNDLVCQNILEGASLMLIDWEYAGVGDPYFDLAVVVQHHLLSPEMKDRFLHLYLGRPVAAPDLQRLELHCKFYACLLQLWNLRTAGI